MEDIHYLGEFPTFNAVWKMFPNGGGYGDYVTILGVRYDWDESTNSWGDDPGDVNPALPEVVNHDIDVQGTVTARDGIKTADYIQGEAGAFIDGAGNAEFRSVDVDAMRVQDPLTGDLLPLPDFIKKYKTELPPDWAEYEQITQFDNVRILAFDPLSQDKFYTTIGEFKKLIRDSIDTGGVGDGTFDIEILRTDEPYAIPTDNNVFSALRTLAEINNLSHSHSNKSIIDQLTQGNIDVLSKLFVDESDNLYTTQNFYSQQEISAYGIGSGGSGGGGDISKLPSWAGYTSAMADFYAPACLLVPFYNDMQSRVGVLEAGGSGGSTVTWGAESGGYVPLTVEGVSKSVALTTHTHSQYALTTHNHSGVYEPAFTKNDAFNKNFGTTSGTVAEGNHTHSEYALTTHTHSGVYEPVFSKNTAFNKNFGTTSTTVARGNHTHSEYALTTHTHSIAQVEGLQTALNGKASSTHNHSGVYEPVFSKNTAFNKNFGTASGTVAEGNDSRIVNGQTAYSWGNHASAGYALSSALANYVTLATSQTISGAKTFSTNLTASVSVTTPKVIFAAAGWSMEQSTEGVLELKYNGVIKQKFLNDGSIAATGELTAYVAGASGYSEFLPLSGGTLTGNLNISPGVIIGTAAIPLSVRGSSFKYNNSDILHKGNIGSAGITSIGLGNGWTIEQTATNLYIKKNGVIKGTFNA